MFKSLPAVTICIALMGCQPASFDGNAGLAQPANNDSTPVGPNDSTTPNTPINPDDVFDNTPNDQVMNKCFKEWGEAPFDAQAAKNYRILTAIGTGFGAREIADRTNTKEASLVLVKVTVEGFSNINLDLGNPHGWYCIDSSAVGFTRLTIKKNCRATIGNLKNQMTGFGGSQTQEYGDDC